MEEKTYPDNHQTNKSGSKKTILIILGVVGLLCICCATLVGGSVFFAGGLLGEEADEIKAVLYEVCESGDIAANEDADMWFTNDYQGRYTQVEAGDKVAETFPSSFDCSELQTEGLIDLVMSGQGVYVSTVNGKTTAEFTFSNGTDSVLIELTKSDGKWKIDDIN